MGSCLSNPKPAKARADPRATDSLTPNAATAVGAQGPLSTGLSSTPSDSLAVTRKATSAKHPAKTCAVSDLGSRSDTSSKPPHPSNSSRAQSLHDLSLDELRDGLLLTSGKRSKKLDILDYTGQILERNNRKSYGGFSYVSQAKVGNLVVGTLLAKWWVPSDLLA